MLDNTKYNKFYIDRINKRKTLMFFKPSYMIESGKEFWMTKLYVEEFNLGEQLCDFINTDFNSFDNIQFFLDKYSITFFANPCNLEIKNLFYPKDYDKLINDFKKNLKELEDIKIPLKNAVEYIYNMNNLEELVKLTPSERLFVLRNSNNTLNISKLYNESSLIPNFSDREIVRKLPFHGEEKMAQIIAKDSKPIPYYFISKDIISTLLVELFECATINSIEIKKCKNCGKFFVPEKRSDEIYCNNIYENGKTCREIGSFKVQQKLMKENDDLRIYRNVYQKLLLRTLRNPINTDYERDFDAFKKKNAELKLKVSNGEISQSEYMEWLNKQ